MPRRRPTTSIVEPGREVAPWLLFAGVVLGVLLYRFPSTEAVSESSSGSRTTSPSRDPQTRTRRRVSVRTRTTRSAGWDALREVSPRALPAPSAGPFDVGAMPRAEPSQTERQTLGESYDRWRAETEVADATDVVRDHLATMLADFEVHPKDVAVSCTETICRTELAFDATTSLERIAAIPYDAERLRFTSTSDGGETRLIAYWDRDVEAPF